MNTVTTPPYLRFVC
ncbi:hypothetical protein Pint_05830 [Pistacia integerrima]|uniref:Uncharacterized protein n=1 Tax=Pistacia integerrima TaxID=434235 RepID=A0ACC0Z8T5_9ROSI|nr:hypothetical protein Pint_05830 [Pistacia integerrima]